MQVERLLFRMAERANRSQHSDTCWTIIMYAALLIGSACLGFFVYGEVAIKHDLHDLSSCFGPGEFSLQADELAFVYTPSAQSLGKTVQNLKPHHTGPACSIYKNVNYTDVTEESELMFTGLYAVYKMQKKQLAQLSFDNYTIVLRNRSLLKDTLYSVSTLIANELVNLADQQKLGSIVINKEVYVRSSTLRMYYADASNPSKPTSQLLAQLLLGPVQIVLCYAVISVVTSLYIYVTIITSPAIILLFLKMTPYGNTEQYFQNFKSFPWIGMHSMILRASGNQLVRDHYIGICSSLIVYFFVMYMGYYTVILEVTNLYFDQPTEAGVGEILFGYFAIVQFTALVFMRTRPFLKYFPILNTFLIFSFMLYCKYCHFGFKILGVVTMHAFGVAIFSWMVLNLEIPAVKTWRPDQSTVPSIRKPRAGLIPVFNLNWMNGLPDEWTILMPLSSPEHFSRNQLALVDQDYQRLNQYLNQ